MASFMKAVVLIVWMVELAVTDGQPDPESLDRLVSTLLSGYNYRIPPTQNGAVNVSVGFSLLYFDFFDEPNELATVHGWLQLSWTDPRLSWDSQASTISSFMTDAKTIWLPDIELFNSARITKTHETRAVVSSTGYVYMMPSYQIELICRMDLEFDAFDQQKCVLKYGSFHHDGFVIDVHLMDRGLDLALYTEARDFVVTNATSKKNVEQYDCCPQTYPYLEFTIWWKRAKRSRLSKVQEGNIPDAYSNLLTDLLHGYHKNVPPIHNASLEVEIGFSLIYFDFIDEANELATVHGWLKLGWTDTRLSWDPKAYNNLSRVVIDLKDIWVPDIELYNSARKIKTHETKVLLYSNGYLFQIPSYQIEFICRMDLQFFPYDKQKCQLKFGSWMHSQLLLDLKLMSSKLDIEDHVEARDFLVTDTAAQRNVKTYPCCPDELWVDVTFTISLKRSSNAYGTKLVLPAVLSGFLVLATFLIPPASHEKITLCGMLFLCLLLQLVYLYLIIPSVGDTILEEYLVFALFIDFFAAVMAVVSYNVNMRLSPVQTRYQTVMDTEGEYSEMTVEKPTGKPKKRKKEWLRHLDKACFVLFSVVFIVGLAIILGRRA